MGSEELIVAAAAVDEQGFEGGELEDVELREVDVVGSRPPPDRDPREFPAGKGPGAGVRSIDRDVAIRAGADGDRVIRIADDDQGPLGIDP